MDNIPDAPFIRDAERYGMDYVHDYLYGAENIDEEEEDYD